MYKEIPILRWAIFIHFYPLICARNPSIVLYFET